jgi:hypothetical protein
MTKLEIKETRNTLLDCVWDKYKPENKQFHDLFFKDSLLTFQEVEDAVDTFVNKCMETYGDVMCENNDMFCVRDIILLRRGADYTELECGLWIRHYVEGKRVGVVEFRASVMKDKKYNYEEMKITNPGYVSHNTFREYWLAEWDAICMNGWVDKFLDKIYNNKR